ncbi:ATP cone domain-containing protein [uncultured Marixanthomonas sp.]|uniref:ATP cone domain-containing protein n=1 Tax=uncultured Marixanthomonas sp. TaxID=757245 RepID=UPI0030D97957|tara:strand:- start:41875 stop:42717 length:843 start_codon:yes stop_codon:yes gene_type:complete
MKPETNSIELIKSSGKRVRFSIEKLKASLRHSGADTATIDKITNTVRDELYQGISTKEIYNRAFAMLKKKKLEYASKYKLKKAIYELGPTGFPFEKFIGALYQYSGYQIKVGKVLEGKCVSHEVDVIAQKKNHHILAECKFHSEEGRNCDVKIPLYIHSRFQDIIESDKENKAIPKEGWVVTNTRFTKDAEQYGLCVSLQLLSWNYPTGNGLKDRIDRLGLYPITVSTLLSKREKQFLLSRDVVLCRQLLSDKFYLDHLGISEKRKQRIFSEISILCNNS